jgi:hypothetical protein
MYPRIYHYKTTSNSETKLLKQSPYNRECTGVVRKYNIVII